MALTTEQLQRYHALHRYSEALKNTRTTYLKLLEMTEVSEKKIDSIWHISFILQYMIASHEKYSRLLASLHQDKRALAILGKLCDQVTIDPAKDLQGFINQAQTIMQSEAFKSDLAKLSRAYNIEGIARLIGCVLMMAVAAILGIALVQSTGGLIIISTPLFVGACAYLKVTGEEACRKRDNINHAIDSLTTTEPATYSLVEEHSYQAVNTQNNSSTATTIKKTHTPMSTTSLKQSFFQSHMHGHKALNIEVQSEFNLLTN